MHGAVERTSCKKSRKSYQNDSNVGRFYDRVTKIQIVYTFAYLKFNEISITI